MDGTDEDDGEFGDLFAVDEEDWADGVNVSRADGLVEKNLSEAKEAASTELSQQMRTLRVSDYGEEGFWHGRWGADVAGDAAYEWFTVGAAVLAAALRGVTQELGLAKPLAPGQPPRVIELGCGLSRISLDLVLSEGWHGVVATDIVPRCVEVGREFAARAGVGPPQLDYAVQDSAATSYANGAFQLVLDKGMADCFALRSEDYAEDTGERKALIAYLGEVRRLLKPGGYFAVVTAWTPDRRRAWLQEGAMGAAMELVSTTVVHRDGPAAEHLLIMKRRSERSS